MLKSKLQKFIGLKYYGWRWPIFGLFPNIVTSDTKSFPNPVQIKKNDLFENPKIAKFQLINSTNLE